MGVGRLGAMTTVIVMVGVSWLDPHGCAGRLGPRKMLFSESTKARRAYHGGQWHCQD